MVSATAWSRCSRPRRHQFLKVHSSQTHIMIGSFQTGVSGLQVFQKDLEVIGNNIANVNTVGYKSSHMEFQDALSASLVTGSNPMQVGTGVSTAAINTSYTGGPINPTGNTNDLAISGAGFFLLKDCLLYTSPSPRDRTRSRMPSSA